MKLMRLAPILCTLAILAGSSAFAAQVKFHYDVMPAGPTLTNSAVIGAGDCCGGTVINQAAVINTSCDPYLPLWQQATLDTQRRWGERACGLPNVCETAPVTYDAVTLGAVIGNRCGDVMVQPAIVNGRCGDDVFTSPIGGRMLSAPNCDTCGLMTQSAIIDDGPSTFPATLPPIHMMAQPAIINSGCGQVLTQPAIIDNGCGQTLTQPALIDNDWN